MHTHMHTNTLVHTHSHTRTLSLGSQNNQHVSFTEAQVTQWLVQLALPLHHLHMRNILHRDLKTKNVFVTQVGAIV
jgi:serine/threonine protein kinase